MTKEITTPYQLAFKNWKSTFPAQKKGDEFYVAREKRELAGTRFKIPENYDGDCNCPGGSSYHSRIVIEEDGNLRKVPRPDKDVCKRERAWRYYCAIRDLGGY